ncbi:dihydrodipicolinate synthase family protein [Halomonas sp. M4R1S46]|uniref:dihydrodipicolinate synthase family protein n=1 Tax=Halomonas sp. M4R1S46 TaxID=2982692 RepID=UPI0029657215|nr:dihydrodipicolinate synthase family protein [Halomonas sp. M4R1S46]
MSVTHDEVKQAISAGLLSFPITDCDARGRFDADSYRQRPEWFISHEASAVCVAGGIGEFFNLSQDDFREVVRLPVIASAGFSVATGSVRAPFEMPSQEARHQPESRWESLDDCKTHNKP